MARYGLVELQQGERGPRSAPHTERCSTLDSLHLTRELLVIRRSNGSGTFRGNEGRACRGRGG